MYRYMHVLVLCDFICDLNDAALYKILCIKFCTIQNYFVSDIVPVCMYLVLCYFFM
jgi:hypothetical protein